MESCTNIIGEDTQIRIDVIKNKRQQKLSIQEESLSTSENINQVNTNANKMLELPIDTTKMSAQYNSIEQKGENVQTEETETEVGSIQQLTLSHSKTIPEYEQRLEKLEKTFASK
ncbi:uncharacterized protein LOC105187117 [Harpegnathos saltator]|nr:uncharacterized protein LOC105187117 [Harpegnathos saltator]